MSNISKDTTSIRVHAPPGGHSNNIFGTSEFEQSAANKKKQSESNIFGSNKDNVEPAPVRQTRNAGNNIFGTDAEGTTPNAATMAGQYKQTQMKSSIFGTDEPTTTTRHVSDKNKSNIFGTDEPTVSTRGGGDKNKSNIFGIGDDQNKRQGGGRRDPNASRMGYNPINGESYSTKDNVNEKQPDSTVKKPEEETGNGQAPPTNPTENDNAQVTPANTAEKDNVQAAPATTTANGNAQKPVEKADNAQKNVHTSVRVVHPPGGKSNGPLW